MQFLIIKPCSDEILHFCCNLTHPFQNIGSIYSLSIHPVQLQNNFCVRVLVRIEKLNLHLL